MLRVAERQPDLGSICVFHTPTEGPAAPGAWRGHGATGVGEGEGEGLGGFGGAVGCIWRCQVHGHRGEAATGRFPGGRPTRPPGTRKEGDVVASWRRRRRRGGLGRGKNEQGTSRPPHTGVYPTSEPLTLTLTLELQGAIGRMYPNERLEFRGAAYNPNPNPSLELRGAAWNPNPDGGGQPEPQARIEGRGLPVGGERTWRFSQLLSLPVGGVPASCRPRVGVDSLTWCRSVGNQPPTRHHV